jgi:hypothetical protein
MTLCYAYDCFLLRMGEYKQYYAANTDMVLACLLAQTFPFFVSLERNKSLQPLNYTTI